MKVFGSIRVGQPWFVAVVFAVVFLIASSSYADSDILFRSGSWIGKSRFDEQSGRFARCTIEAKYRNGTTLTLSVNGQYDLEIWLYNPDWSLTQNNSYPVQYWVDSFDKETGNVTARLPYLALIRVKRSRSFFNWLQRGNYLYVRGAAQSLTFSLKDTSKALPELLDCVDRSVARQPPKATTANPFLTPNSRNPFSNLGGAEGLRGESINFATSLFSDPDLRGKFQILHSDQVPQSFQKNHVVWVGEGVLGTIDHLRTNQNARELVGMIIAADNKDCTGKFASAKEEFDDPRIGRIVRLNTACASSTSIYVNYTFYPRRAGGFYRIATVAFSQSLASGTDELIRDVIGRAIVENR